LRARAIENQCYVIGVNRVGDEPALHYAGDSAVVDSYGRAIVELEGADMATVELDMEALNTFRTKFNVGADADTFTMEI
jgi:predicted amidohydrolase